jgi:hypothetical protein
MWEEPWIYNRENSRQHDREPISSLLRDGFISHQPPVPLKDDFNVFLYLNGNSIARSHVNEITNNKKVFGELMETFTMQATLNLKAGDQIWLMVAYSSAGLVLCGSNVTHFTGFMLQEDISQSVKLSI